MLKIRLQRVGRKHEPSFRLVLTDSKNSTKSGRFKEVLGAYDPRKTTERFNVERIRHWLSMGASPTGTVHNLLVEQKIVEGKKVNVLPKKTYNPPQTTDDKAEAPAARVPVEATPAEQATETPVEEPASQTSEVRVAAEPSEVVESQ